MLSEIDNLNVNLFNPCKLKIAYKSNCLTSWIQIEIIDYGSLNATRDTQKENEMITIENINGIQSKEEQ